MMVVQAHDLPSLQQTCAILQTSAHPPAPLQRGGQDASHSGAGHRPDAAGRGQDASQVENGCWLLLTRLRLELRGMAPRRCAARSMRPCPLPWAGAQRQMCAVWQRGGWGAVWRPCIG